MFKSVFVLVLFSSVLYGLDGNLIKLLGVSDGILVAGLRAMGACLFLSIARRGAAPVMNLVFWGAVACSAIASMFFVLAAVRIPVGVALVLFHGAILWIVLYKWLLMRPITRVDTITGTLVLVGLALLCIQKVALEAPLGWMFGLLAGACFAGYLFLGDEHRAVHQNDKVFSDTFLLGQAVLVVVACLRMEFGQELVEPSLFQAGGYIVLGLLYGLAYWILSKAMAIAGNQPVTATGEPLLPVKSGGSQLVSIYMGALEPPLGLVFGVLLCGDRLTQQSIYGFILIVVSVTARSYLIYRKKGR